MLAMLTGLPALGHTTLQEKENATAVLLTDFTEPALNARWFARNDNVMGGRSIGQLSIDSADAGVMTMTGRINTNGGGFTSVMMDLSQSNRQSEEINLPDLSGVIGVRLQVRASADPVHRPWRLRVRDDVPRQRGINFRGLLPIDVSIPTDQWQTVTVWLEDLQPTLSGRELNPTGWAPLNPQRIRRLGIMLNDTGDGPYQLDIRRIELVRLSAQ
jgi:hypothetical protein